MAVLTLTSDNFDTAVKESGKPVLIDFYADWCGPCRMLAPLIEEAEEEYADQVLFCRVNVDDEESLAARYGVSSIPTLVLLKNGETAARSVGYLDEEALRDFILQ